MAGIARRRVHQRLRGHRRGHRRGQGQRLGHHHPPSQDPHSYEANAQDKLTVSKAKLVLENGGGYDDFIHKLADDSNVDHENIINAVDVSGLAPETGGTGSAHAEDGHSHVHGDFNEHVWYSLTPCRKLADAVAARLGALDSASAARSPPTRLPSRPDSPSLRVKLAAMKAAHGGAGVAVTEPVPLYLLEAAGLENQTPAEYTAAIEEGSDVPPAVLKAATSTGRLKRHHGSWPTTSRPKARRRRPLKNAAEAAGVPVVNFTETLPDGKTYLDWMADNVDNISNALKSQR